MQDSNKEIEKIEEKVETQVVCKIKILKNLIENFENKNDLVTKHLDILRSELDRNSNLLEIKQKEIEILSKQNKDLDRNLNESSAKARESLKKMEKFEKELEQKSREIHGLIKMQTGTASEKVEKLNKLLDESSKAAENKINELKNEYELQIKNIQEDKRRLIKEKDDEINSLRSSKESLHNLQQQQKGLVISASFGKNFVELINDSKAYLKKYEIEVSFKNDFGNYEDLSESDLNNYFDALKKLVERYLILL
jgi:chromosome segregation ATPase